ncbi:hypothetical protein KC19_3G095100 [Ceratodon purpureus]|uniref:Uncharacterized protein n=1 Tax=Ceratodon purpureus TaxID=3225 RepID=A0A8T0IJ10_CERPU|nr:hypothetical protein KC19_3G095100 [Ceratodon purpureus]
MLPTAHNTTKYTRTSLPLQLCLTPGLTPCHARRSALYPDGQDLAPPGPGITQPAPVRVGRRVGGREGRDARLFYPVSVVSRLAAGYGEGVRSRLSLLGSVFSGAFVHGGAGVLEVLVATPGGRFLAYFGGFFGEVPGGYGGNGSGGAGAGADLGGERCGRAAGGGVVRMGVRGGE